MFGSGHGHYPAPICRHVLRTLKYAVSLSLHRTICHLLVMGDVARATSRDGAVFKPEEAKVNDAKADAVIEFAKKVKDRDDRARAPDEGQ